jgi:hypothetical protein
VTTPDSGSPDPRITGNDAGDYPVVGPDWKGEAPAGIKTLFRSSILMNVPAGH